MKNKKYYLTFFLNSIFKQYVDYITRKLIYTNYNTPSYYYKISCPGCLNNITILLSDDNDHC